MKSNNSTSFILITGMLVLCIFAGVITYNLLPSNKKSNSYYVKVGEEMDAKIETLDIDNDILTITTSGDASEYCVKSTRSIPEDKNICWKKIEDGVVSISIYQYKEYYVWIKDAKGNISNPMSVNTKESN